MNTLESYDDPFLDLFVKSINVNEKEGTFDASIETSFMEYMDESWFLSKAIWETIVYDKKYENGKLRGYWYERCNFSEDQWGKLNSEDPSYGMVYHNFVSEEKANRISEFLIQPVHKDNYYEEGVGEDNWEYFENYADKNRIYLSGLSNGGMGSFELLKHRPNMFASAVIICGGGNPAWAKEFAKSTSVWIAHGSNDQVVNPNFSLKMAEAIINEGGSPKVTFFENVYHNSWDYVFSDSEYLKWMYSRSKN